MKRCLLVLMIVTLISYGLMASVNAAAVREEGDLGKYFNEFAAGTL